MSRSPGPLVAVGALVMLGLGWGLSQPFGKMATATGHPPQLLIFWQLVICVAALAPVCALRGTWPRLTPEALRFYAVIAVIGTLVPNTTFYISVERLPSGIMSILISTVPLISFPIALALGNDRFSWTRLGGLLLGLAGVALIALPEASLPDPAMAAFLPLALVGPIFYAFEANYVAWRGTGGQDPVQAMLGASIMGLVLCLPILWATGQGLALPWPPGRAEWALVASSVIHAAMYSTYVWLAATAGAVFASQSGYLVTGCGVVWAMVLLGERFPPTVWMAMAVMLAGVALVTPRRKAGMA